MDFLEKDSIFKKIFAVCQGMTGERKLLLSTFSDRVRKLISLHNKLRIQISALDMLNKKLETENLYLKKQYDSLKIAKVVLLKRDDCERTKKKMAFLIKEVSKCMALLRNE